MKIMLHTRKDAMKIAFHRELVALFWLLMTHVALANTVTVTTLADPHQDGYLSLREAIS